MNNVAAQIMYVCALYFSSVSYWIVLEPCIANYCLGGHMEMSFVIRKGMPAKTSTSQSSSTCLKRASFVLECQR